MPFKDKQRRKEYKKQYDLERTQLLNEIKMAKGIPLDKRIKPENQEPTDDKKKT